MTDTESAANKQAVFDVVEAAGITTITVTFEGEGDSGQIEDVSAYKGDAAVDVPPTTIRWHRGWIGEQEQTADLPLEEAIRDLCWDYLSEEHGGWENNDGGYGEFTLDVPTRTVTLEFNGRFTDVHTSTHTF
jgi:hypothetical protein